MQIFILKDKLTNIMVIKEKYTTLTCKGQTMLLNIASFHVSRFSQSINKA